MRMEALRRIISGGAIIAVALLLSGCGRAPQTASVIVEAPLSASSSRPESPASPQRDGATERTLRPAEKIEARIPSKMALQAPFASQAPLGKWDQVHEETCEEASMIMAAKYFSRQPLTADIMEAELRQLVDWEAENGYGLDLTARQAAEILEDKFGLKAEIIKEVTADRIKYEISQGRLVIVPAAGRLLDNPNFKSPGPIYHMLIIKGYDEQEFIANDPGTRKGNGFAYSYANLLAAIHDWTPALVGSDGRMSEADMARGEQVMISIAEK